MKGHDNFVERNFRQSGGVCIGKAVFMIIGNRQACRRIINVFRIADNSFDQPLPADFACSRRNSITGSQAVSFGKTAVKQKSVCLIVLQLAAGQKLRHIDCRPFINTVDMQHRAGWA
ncbi:hypothetical protein SDC9_191676 [bioreactor metagenome]|uniref:Uncharacterized protein n=1 Tax=bioreactor metagenome TaxID=1076179 RepID=A0A645HYJ2_9ZZZZ